MTQQATSYMKDWNAFVSEIKAVKSATNPHFKNKFTPLDAWLDEIHRLATKYNLTFNERISVQTNNDDIYQVHHISVMHYEDTVLHSEYFISLIDKPQAMGSACTYARRYHIQTVLNCTGEDDDDGNTAQAQVTNTTTTVAMTGRRKVS